MLTVLSVAYPLAPVGPDTAGGSEQILALLDSALIENGHRSVVVACSGSAVQGALIATPCERNLFRESAREGLYQTYRAAIRRALETYEIDVIHFHGLDVHQYLPSSRVPVLITLHLPPAWYPPQLFSLERPETYLNCVSLAQRQACPPARCLLPVIENGVPVERLSARVRKRDFALVLGRVCPEKGIHAALDAAALAGSPVLVGGQVFPYEAHERYFHEQVVPRLSRTRRFLGPLTFGRKRRLLSAAKCLLVPSLAPETSSLVAMEALACGTPVIAYSSGALPEIIEDGVTGFLVSDERQMAQAIRKARMIDPARCRRVAVERFSSHAMVERYLELYRSIAAAANHCRVTTENNL